ncbi:PREDICTED: helicase ARIP4-like [Priapulus caudatus]|uniref:Helicase ARIP4-like n=1 Tax=Priapulus caudatus TaxID=37621 RepID=A0ABM1EFK0_PRICU|nr:PREDICTED: helicase ARIP4-like [Priapulus caudatus]
MEADEELVSSGSNTDLYQQDNLLSRSESLKGHSSTVPDSAGSTISNTPLNPWPDAGLPSQLGSECATSAGMPMHEDEPQSLASNADAVEPDSQSQSFYEQKSVEKDMVVSTSDPVQPYSNGTVGDCPVPSIPGSRSEGEYMRGILETGASKQTAVPDTSVDGDADDSRMSFFTPDERPSFCDNSVTPRRNASEANDENTSAISRCISSSDLMADNVFPTTTGDGTELAGLASNCPSVEPGNLKANVDAILREAASGSMDQVAVAAPDGNYTENDACVGEGALNVDFSEEMDFENATETALEDLQGFLDYVPGGETADADAGGSAVVTGTLDVASEVLDDNTTAAQQRALAESIPWEGEAKPSTSAAHKPVKKPRKKLTTKNAGGKKEKDKEKHEGGDDTDSKPKKKRKRKRKGEGKGGEEKKTKLHVTKERKNVHERKNIRKLLDESKLEHATMAAQQEEMDRKRRLAEVQKSLHAAQEQQQQQLLWLPLEDGTMDNQLEEESDKETVQETEASQQEEENKDLPVEDSESMPLDKQPQNELQVPDAPAIKPRKELPAKPVVTMAKHDDVVCLSSDSEEDSFPSNWRTALAQDMEEAAEPEEKDNELIELTSSDDEEKKKERKKEVVKTEDEDSDVVLITSDNSDQADEDDVANSGSHVNDASNQPDSQGRVLVNVGHPPDEPDIFLAPQLNKAVKPHQIGGIRFLYDNLVESLTRCKTSNGFGCILAHSMGLGKTLQLISFTDVFLRHTDCRNVIAIVPVNTLLNWVAEFDLWLPTTSNSPPEEVLTRQFEVFILNDSCKTMASRARVVNKWHSEGGVLIMGYEMYRLLVSNKFKRSSKSKRARARAVAADCKQDALIIDIEEEELNKQYMQDVEKALIRPGPDLVICDEGHRIKNCSASISNTLKNIRTKRRVVLTGYPLQNNLIEYYCMVDFIRPNFLGTKAEFMNMFERPISNGHCTDSMPVDKRLMRFRSHVLHSLLEGFVQRRGHTVLQSCLPPKEEHVLLVPLSPVQKRLYRAFMVVCTSGMSSWARCNPIKAFSVCCKIWNHPDILYDTVRKKNRKVDDLDLDLPELAVDGVESAAGGSGKATTPKRRGRPPKAGSKASPISRPVVADNGNSNMSSMVSEDSDSNFPTSVSCGVSGTTSVPASAEPKQTLDAGPSLFNDKVDKMIDYEWADDLVKDYQPGLLENGGKFVLTLCLLEESIHLQDKVLLFSQSLSTLDLIEKFLGRHYVPLPADADPQQPRVKWSKNQHYYRLDGSTSSSDRERLITQFNESKDIHLFLLSTRAGCLGVNLIGANRVIVFDASWNPCHDAQAVCRVYRYGQRKACHVYRLVADNTLEKKIYDRQITKQGMSDRVVDELQPELTFSKKEVESLLTYQEADSPMVDVSMCADKYTDNILQHICSTYSHWLTKEPFQHEALLLDRKDRRLTRGEKKLARQSYEMEKKAGVSYSRRGDFRSNIGGFDRPVAPVRPMQSLVAPSGERMVPLHSAPIPMQPQHVRVPASTISDVAGALRLPTAGVQVAQVVTTKPIPIPLQQTSTQTTAHTSAMSMIPTGQKIMIIRTPRGIYIRTADGKMFSVKPRQQASAGGGSEIERALGSLGLPQGRASDLPDLLPTVESLTGAGRSNTLTEVVSRSYQVTGLSARPAPRIVARAAPSRTVAAGVRSAALGAPSSARGAPSSARGAPSSARGVAFASAVRRSVSQGNPLSSLSSIVDGLPRRKSSSDPALDRDDAVTPDDAGAKDGEPPATQGSESSPMEDVSEPADETARSREGTLSRHDSLASMQSTDSAVLTRRTEHLNLSQGVGDAEEEADDIIDSQQHPSTLPHGDDDDEMASRSPSNGESLLQRTSLHSDDTIPTSLQSNVGMSSLQKPSLLSKVRMSSMQKPSLQPNIRVFAVKKSSSLKPNVRMISLQKSPSLHATVGMPSLQKPSSLKPNVSVSLLQKPVKPTISMSSLQNVSSVKPCVSNSSTQNPSAVKPSVSISSMQHPSSLQSNDGIASLMEHSLNHMEHSSVRSAERITGRQHPTLMKPNDSVVSVERNEGVTSLHEGVTSLQRNEGVASLQHEGMVSLQHEGVATLQHEGVTSLQRNEGVASLQRNEGVASLQQNEGVASLQHNEGVASLQRNEGVDSLQKFDQFI